MISATLRRLRKERGVSQTGLAAALYVSQQAVSKWETGTAEPDMRELSALADFYGVTTDYILGRGDELTARLLDFRRRMTPEQAATLCGVAERMIGERADDIKRPV